MKQTKIKDQIQFQEAPSDPTPTTALDFGYIVAIFAGVAIVALASALGGYKLAKRSNQELESSLGTQIEAVVRHAGETARYNATRAYPVWIGFGDGKDTQWYNISQPNWRLERTITAMTHIRSYVGDNPKNAPTNSLGLVGIDDIVGRAEWIREKGDQTSGGGWVTEFFWPTWWLEKGSTNSGKKTFYLRPGWQLQGDVQQSGDITVTAEDKGKQ